MTAIFFKMGVVALFLIFLCPHKSLHYVLKKKLKMLEWVESYKYLSQRWRNHFYMWALGTYLHHDQSCPHLYNLSWQWVQSFTSLMADLRQDINRVSSFIRCLSWIFPWRNCSVKTLVHCPQKRRVANTNLLLWVNLPNLETEHFLQGNVPF